ncbi:hypothetical protein [Cohnella sp.]
MATIMRRDNDTSVQPQLIAMGAASSDPGRGENPMRAATPPFIGLDI